MAAKGASSGKKFTKTEKSWILYDWANSVYATNILAVIFPIYFGNVCRQNGADNLVLWSYGTSISTFVVAILAPVLGALADHKGHKKKLFAGFLAVGVGFTLVSALFSEYRMLLMGYVLSHIGFSGSCLFYDSFLTDVTTSERMDRVSSWGYAMGYIGGSTIPFLISIVILLIMGMENMLAFKLVIVLTSLWWAVFSIPFLKNVRQVHYIEAQKNLLRSTLQNLVRTARGYLRPEAYFPVYGGLFLLYRRGGHHHLRVHLLRLQAEAGQYQHDPGPAYDPDRGRSLLHPLRQAGGENRGAEGSLRRGDRVFLHLPLRLLYGLQHREPPR